MPILKLSALSLVAMGLTAVTVAPASARPYDSHGHHPHKVCKFERHHGHRVQVCHIVR